ncbi:Arginase/deacetylase [Dentipellis sp. KUC8613]|nr:Arginase/deacetylase [Dentipellis sp. KUC8613]
MGDRNREAQAPWRPCPCPCPCPCTSIWVLPILGFDCIISMDSPSSLPPLSASSPPQPPQQQPQPSPRRVLYVASERLAKLASLLPSNPNRALAVHALHIALGLLRPEYPPLPPSVSTASAPADSTQNSPAQAHADAAANTDAEDAPPPPPRTTFRLLRPPPATAQDLAAFHTKDYIAALLAERPNSKTDEHTDSGAGTGADVEFGLEDDCPPFAGLGAYALAIAGATLAAARALARGEADVAICWDGGRHHAHKSHASGFCYVNDCVLALLALKRASTPLPRALPPSPPPRKPRIMYLDLDLHFGDAVAAAFHTPLASRPAAPPPQILTLSMHHTHPTFFPPSPLAGLPDPASAAFDPYTLALPLRAGYGARTVQRVWDGAVERVRAAYKPDVVVLQCGCDALAGDRCAVGNWSLGGAGAGKGEGGMGWCVARVLAWPGARVLLLGGGGYNTPSAARAYAYLTSIARGAPLPLDTPIPEHAGFPLYAPGFTLDVLPGNVRDENGDAWVEEVCGVFGEVARVIRERAAA